MGLDYVSRFTEPLQRRLLRALEIAATGIVPSDITSTGSVGPSFVNTHQSWFIRLVTAAEGLDTRLSGISAGLADGDKGDVIVSGGGLIWNIQNGVLTSAKLGGDVTTAGKALLTAADASAQRTALGLGTAATQATGTFVQRVGDTMTGPLVIGGGTVTASTPVLNLTQTWNQGATLFEGVVINVANSASLNTSRLLTAKTSGGEMFYIRRDGVGFFGGTLVLGNGTLNIGANADVILQRNSAGVLDLRNLANAQTWNVYGTTDAGLLNYRRLRTTITTGGAATISAEGLGTGVSGNTLAFAVGTAVSPTTVVTLDGTTMTFANAKHLAFDTSGGTKIGTANNQKLSFWNATPIVQPSSTGETVGFTAGAGTPVMDASTFTGNVGSTAYRISDIVKALKSVGLIAA